MKFQKLSIVVVLAAAWGCAGNDAVNIGDNTPRAKTGELLSDYAASWDGYAEAFKFTSGSDRVRIELDDEGHGTIVLGDGAPPAPATDPEGVYAPLGFGIPGDVTLSGPLAFVSDELAEGFAYTVQGAEVQEKRIRFGIDSKELYKSWCELQTPVHDTSGAPGAPEYGCLPYFESASSIGEQCYIQDYPTGDWVEVACAKITFCGANPVCSCTASGCTVAPLASADATSHVLDAALDDGGDALAGTFVVNERVTVRMERQ